MDRGRAFVIGLLIFIVIFGGAMVLRVAARFFYSVAFFLEAIGVLLFAFFLGWAGYRILAGDTNDPRSIEQLHELE